MDELKLRVMSAVINFLKAELDSGNLDPEKREGLEVAIQCLEIIYDVNGALRLPNEPCLSEIYKFFFENAHLNRHDATAEEKAEGEALKVEANQAMIAGKYAEALCLYTRAIECDPRNPFYYCNRAAAKSRMNDHTSAVRDCEIAIELDPGYSKAYGRLGLAYCGLERYAHAVECYQKAHELEPENEAFKCNLNLAKEKVKDMCAHEPEAQTQSDANNAETPTTEGDGTPRPSQSPIDINMLLGIPELLNIASQVLAGPALQSFTYTRAREIPDIFNHFRQTFSSDPSGSNSPQDNVPSHHENE